VIDLEPKFIVLDKLTSALDAGHIVREMRFKKGRQVASGEKSSEFFECCSR
jgi:hypothetical protein